MVRLIVTDYHSKEEYEDFYTSIDELEPLKELFVYYKYRKYKAYLPRSHVHENIYSLNILSRKYLDYDNFLIYIGDSEFYILFNHKTIYSAKINENFITDDMIKSILIAKHLTMLSSGGSIDKIYYIIDSKYKFAIENILKQNTKNENNQVIATELGHVETLVKKVPEMDTLSTFVKKNSVIAAVLFIIYLTVNSVLPFIEKNYLEDNFIEKYEKELQIEQRLNKRLLNRFEKVAKEHKDLTQCISNIQVQKND